MKPVIETERLTLRISAIEEAEPLFTLFNNWNVVQWLSGPPWPVDLGGTRTFIAKCAAEGLDFEELRTIEFEGAPIGTIGWRNRPASHLQSAAGPNIGYWLGEPYWGRGLMSEAVRALVSALFTSLPVPAIHSGLFDGNAGSLRIQEKLGFVIEGHSMLFSNPRHKDLPHLNTVLTRDAFAG